MLVSVRIEEILKSITESLGALKDAIKDQTTATNQAKEASCKEWSQIPGLVSAVINSENNAHTERAQSEEKKRKDEEQPLIDSQVRIAKWTKRACIAAIAYGAVAFWQGCLMHHTYREMHNQTDAAKQSAFSACLTARATQQTFLQIQKSAIDSHVATEAMVQQTEAQIQSQRAIIRIVPRSPTPEEFIRQVPGLRGSIDQMGIPYTLKNDGKSAGLNNIVSLSAILLEPGDKLVIPQKLRFTMHGSLPAGEQFPSKMEPGSPYSQTTQMIPVEDVNGSAVLPPSPAYNDFFAGKAEVMVLAKFSYHDDWGQYLTKFCNPQFIMMNNTTRPPSTDAEMKCTDYNHDDSQYPNLPKVGPLSPPEKIDLVTCTPPK
jgi:hypothetical protein